MTLYSALLLVHLLSVVVWVGGKIFALFCLRPAAIAVLPPPQRIPLLHAALARFFTLVIFAIVLILASGITMMASVGMKNAPFAWQWMMGLGVVMMAIFFHLRAVPFARLDKCMQAQDWPAAARHLDRVRIGVLSR